ncbi:MAG TPA: hypothetical protein VNH83_14315 [Bryobacteraceae bacterium]|nr:hypothetical protein [Bryobacteraceae bacterium]
MISRFYLLPIFVLISVVCLAAEDVVSAVHGTIQKTDSVAKTIVVKTVDGGEHTFHFVGHTAVHGAEKIAAGARDAYHGLKEGSEVVVHYTAKGGEETAQEVDRIGEGGLKVAEGTVTRVDRGAKTLTFKTANGADETYQMADHAVKDAGKDIATGAEKSGKVTVYYTEKAGHKVVHFFKAL